MALMTDAAMVLQCDVTADEAGHDDWHTYEHLHERLSIPGFVRGTRWTRLEGSPHYLIVYEIESVEVATSPHYLARLNDPTPWTASTMQRLAGMRRGFCRVAAAGGYGLGRAALSLRFAARDEGAWNWLAGQVRIIASRRGMGSVALLEPRREAPMTKEQSIRGRDLAGGAMLLATAYEPAILGAVVDDADLERHGVLVEDRGLYELAFTATAAEVARTPANPPVIPPVNRP